jgi:hypothetical protein
MPRNEGSLGTRLSGNYEYVISAFDINKLRPTSRPGSNIKEIKIGFSIPRWRNWHIQYIWRIFSNLIHYD